MLFSCENGKKIVTLRLNTNSCTRRKTNKCTGLKTNKCTGLKTNSTEYMSALEVASVDNDITKFCEFIISLLKG